MAKKKITIPPHRVRRPLFSKNHDFVATSFFHRGDKLYKPGDKIKKGSMRVHVLRTFFQRRMIGPAKDPWTESMISARLRKQEILKMREKGMSNLEIAQYFESGAKTKKRKVKAVKEASQKALLGEGEK